jgi:hypothetical protein
MITSSHNIAMPYPSGADKNLLDVDHVQLNRLGGTPIWAVVVANHGI